MLFFLFLLCLAGGTLAWALRAQSLFKKQNPAGKKAALWAWIFACAQIAGLAVVLLSRNGQPEAAHAWSRPLATVLFVWYLIGVPLFLLLTASGAAWSVFHRMRRLFFSSGKSILKPQAVPPPNGISRRDLISAAAHGAPALLSLGSPAISAQQLEHFRVRKMEVPLPNLPKALDGFTITHLSDTHVGRFTHGRILSSIVETTESLGSDLICFTGDLINFSLGDLPPGIEMLQALKARFGLYLCEGNHDLMHNAAGFRRALEKASLRLLVCDSEKFRVGNQTVQISGLPWLQQTPKSRGPDLMTDSAMQTLARQVQPDAFPILLAHHPHSFDAAQHFRLTLSGHTHGGQFMLTPQFGCGPAFYRYWSGLHFQKERSLCVSNGVGNWFPIRVSAPAEIIQLTLRSATPVAATNASRDLLLKPSAALPEYAGVVDPYKMSSVTQNGRPSA
jgi:predicted MPP superfamily phosphohydrolase